MKKTALIILAVIAILALSSGSTLKISFNPHKDPFNNELESTIRIIFTNNKDNALKFTISDAKVIKQIKQIMSKSKQINGEFSNIQPDYSIDFILANGKKITFDYWMGATQNNKELNLKDQEGKLYSMQDSLDTYIINSTKMYERPQKFVDLYSLCISESISMLNKQKSGITTVGIDIRSDRRMRKYTMSYEEENLFKSIKVDGYSVLPYDQNKTFTYIVTFITNIYNPTKAKVTVEAVKTDDKTKSTFIFQAELINGIWTIKGN